jgi:hypothetical protein
MILAFINQQMQSVSFAAFDNTPKSNLPQPWGLCEPPLFLCPILLLGFQFISIRLLLFHPVL